MNLLLPSSSGLVGQNFLLQAIKRDEINRIIALHVVRYRQRHDYSTRQQRFERRKVSRNNLIMLHCKHLFETIYMVLKI